MAFQFDLVRSVQTFSRNFSFMFETLPGDRYLKNGVSKSIIHMIKYANFQLYRVHPTNV